MKTFGLILLGIIYAVGFLICLIFLPILWPLLLLWLIGGIVGMVVLLPLWASRRLEAKKRAHEEAKLDAELRARQLYELRKSQGPLPKL